MVNKCRIYNEDSRARSAHYKSLSVNKGKNQYCGKLYSASTDKGKHMVSYEKKPSEGETLTSIKCFKCDELGHHANECSNNVMRCFKHGKTSHRVSYCKSVRGTCYNCAKQCHISTNCQKLKKVQSGGKVL